MSNNMNKWLSQINEQTQVQELILPGSHQIGCHTVNLQLELPSTSMNYAFSRMHWFHLLIKNSRISCDSGYDNLCTIASGIRYLDLVVSVLIKIFGCQMDSDVYHYSIC